MSQQPVYRRPRSHAYSCRCPRCAAPPAGGWGIIAPAVLIIGAVAVLGFWPAMVWHGTSDTGGWRWDVSSTIACAIWWTLVLGPILVAAVTGVSKGRARCPGQRPAPVQVPPSVPEAKEALDLDAAGAPRPAAPACQHLHAVRAESILDPRETRAYWCGECGTRLPEEFGYLLRPCCGTPPGGPHWGTCPQAAERAGQP